MSLLRLAPGSEIVSRSIYKGNGFACALRKRFEAFISGQSQVWLQKQARISSWPIPYLQLIMPD
jgi:hypothetical protein